MTPQRLLGLVLLGALTVVVTACTAISPPRSLHHLDRDPHRVGTPAPDYAGADLVLPHPFDVDPRVFNPGWDAPPLESEGVYLAPVVSDDRITFTAVSEGGTVLWTAERPMLCSAFVVTTSDMGPLAVLMDITAGESTVSETTISAYDLHTGAKRWGPVAVPGPHVGPGLVFAAPPPESMGESGPRFAIDPATGHTLADEATKAGLLILGETAGTVLLADDTRLISRTADEPESWSLPLTALDQSADDLRLAPAFQPDRNFALLGDRATGATLVSLDEGTLVAHGVRSIAQDRSTGIRILLGDELHAVDAAGYTLWSRAAPADATLVSAGDGFAYLRSATGIGVVDTASGETATSLPSDTLVPQQISKAGAGIIGFYEKPLLVAAPR